MQESCVPSAVLLFALATATDVAATAGRVATLAGAGNVTASGQNQGGNGKREENQRAAGHVFLQVSLLSGGRNGVVSNRRDHLSRKVGFVAGP